LRGSGNPPFDGVENLISGKNKNKNKKRNKQTNKQSHHNNKNKETEYS